MSDINISSFDNLGLALESPGYAKSMSTGSIPVRRQRLSFSCSKFSMDKAAQGGHVDVLQLLHNQVTDATALSTQGEDLSRLFRA